MGKTGVGQKEEELPVKYLKRKSNITGIFFALIYARSPISFCALSKKFCPKALRYSCGK